MGAGLAFSSPPASELPQRPLILLLLKQRENASKLGVLPKRGGEFWLGPLLEMCPKKMQDLGVTWRNSNRLRSEWLENSFRNASVSLKDFASLVFWVILDATRSSAERTRLWQALMWLQVFAFLADEVKGGKRAWVSSAPYIWRRLVVSLVVFPIRHLEKPFWMRFWFVTTCPLCGGEPVDGLARAWPGGGGSRRCWFGSWPKAVDA